VLVEVLLCSARKRGLLLNNYEIIWSSRFGGQGSRTVHCAVLARTWADEFRDKGADTIVIKRNGEPLSESDLSELIKSEADETRNAMRA
jgi:hypothetical protein